MNNIRALFPFLSKGNSVVYLDSAATSLKTEKFIEEISEYYRSYSLNNHSESSNYIHRKLRQKISSVREKISKIINSEASEVSFVPSATYAFNILSVSLEVLLKKGDKIVVTKLEHSSNLFPWQNLAIKKSCELDFADIREDFSVDIESLKKKINKKTKIFSVFHMSNSLGSINDIEKIASEVKKINPECSIIVDACQSFSLCEIDVKKWKVDSLIFSAHKAYGPTGLGVMWISVDFFKRFSDILWGGGKNISPLEAIAEGDIYTANKRFEVGTLPIAQLFGFHESLKFHESIDKKKISNDILSLRNYAIERLKELNSVEIYGEKSKSSFSIINFNLRGINAHDVVDYLGSKNVFVRAGNFCCPLLCELIGVNSSIRVSFSVYNNKSDVDLLVSSLKELSLNNDLIYFFNH